MYHDVLIAGLLASFVVVLLLSYPGLVVLCWDVGML